MGRIIKFSVVDSSGAGVSGQTVSLGGVEMTTSATGMAQMLIDEEDVPSTFIAVNGVRAWEGPVTQLKPLEVLTTAGQRRS